MNTILIISFVMAIVTAVLSYISAPKPANVIDAGCDVVIGKKKWGYREYLKLVCLIFTLTTITLSYIRFFLLK